MNVKVQCPCGTRFAFDIEPVHGRMPMAINCPGCNADATERANAVIQSQPTPPAPTPRTKIVATVVSQSAPAIAVAPVAVPASSSAMRISRTEQAPTEAAQAQPGGATRKCPRHPTEFAKEVCCVCGKPICRKCMEISGYVCSVYCREQAEHKHIEIPEYAGKKVFKEYETNKKLTGAVMGIAALVFLVLGVWGWYAWFARSPKVIYSVEVVPPHYLDAYRVPDYYRLVGPNQLLVIKDKSVALMEPQGQKQLWTTQLRTEADAKAAAAAHAKNDDLRRRAPRVQDEFGNTITKVEGLDPLEAVDDHLFDEPRAIVTSNDVWVAFAQRIVRLDRLTGSFKDVPAVPDKIGHIRPTQEMLLVTSYTDAGKESLTRILLPEGTAESEVITTNRFAAFTSRSAAKPTPKPTAAATKPAGTMAATKPAETPQRGTRGARAASPTNTTGRARGAVLPTTPAPVAAKKSADDDEADVDLGDLFDYGGHPYIMSGRDVIEFKTKLKERRTISHEAMKTPAPAPGKSVLDDQNLTASRGVDLAHEMANESRRAMTGGLDVQDVSLYEVTVHRHFAKDEADWTGEVIGPPEFTPLKTVDIVAGYSNIVVLDKSHKKLWEAKLTFPVISRYSREDEGRSLPCLETKDALYYADKGVLTRFDLATGSVRWRLPSVGVSDIQADAQGNLYVDTTDANPESIKYSQELDLERETKLAIIKVNATDGKVKWRHELGGNRFHFLPPGRFVFSERTWTVLDPTRLEEGPIAHYNMKLHNPASGGVIWVYPQTKHELIRSEVIDNWIMLDFDDRLLVLKFFSL